MKDFMTKENETWHKLGIFEKKVVNVMLPLFE